MTTPSATITIGGTDVSDEYTLVEVIRRENAGANAQIIFSNDASKLYSAIDLYDTARIDLQCAGSSATEVFGGYLTSLKPASTMAGRVMVADLLGFDVALKRMRVAQEYGTESKNPTLYTVREILTEANFGIIPKYVNTILAGATASQYAIQTVSGGDNYIYNEPTSIRYLNYPYAPASDALRDICDLISADNYPAAGTHWQIIPSAGIPYLCVDVIAAHHAPITNLWPTSTTLGTLTQEDGGVTDALFCESESEANYIVYVGVFEKPTAERWTEGANVHLNWGFSLGAGSSPAGIVGNECVCCTGAGGSFYYPGAGTLGLDVTKFGTTRTIPSLSFYARRSAGVTGLLVELTMSAGNYYYHNIFADLPNAAEWRHFNLPVGPYCTKADWVRNFQWLTNGAVNWNDVNYVWFVFIGAAGSTVDIDDLQFHGMVTRGAKSNAAIAAQKARMKLVTDDVGKDDCLTVAGTGVMGQLAKAELIRSMTTPVVGRLTMPMQESVLPGQLQHCHFEEKSDGTFNVNDDFRIPTVTHRLSDAGATTTLELTDDIVNGYPLSPMNQLNLLLRAVNPDFQDRDRGSIKAATIDLLQTILETNY